jgi:D-beta-D-heptose 7-phosphate kinase/D-beta-D-heptose 1-phosphate adenosyltransferase
MMRARSKIKNPGELQELFAAKRQEGRRIVFTNGCFDLMHVGHLRYLEAARELGDLLVVGVNSDRSVRMIKGPKRPIISEDQRSEVVAGLHCVDLVTLFDDPDPLALIQLLKPDILVKGADWPIDKIVGASFVLDSGGDVVRIPLIPDVSTTTIIERIVSR